MTEEKKATKKSKKHIARRNLATSQGQIKKGQEFTCTDKELEIFKKSKAV